MRRGARNSAATAAHAIEDSRIISQSPDINWVFYHGPISPTSIATGYDVKQHEGWCIPLSLFREKKKLSEDQFLKKVEAQARLLKIRDDGIVKRNYTGDGWWVVAPPPDSRPVYGTVIKAQPYDRSQIMAVPTKTSTTSGDPMQRLDQLKKKRQAERESKNFPGDDDVWIGTTRIRPDGTVEIYPFYADDPRPLMVFSRTATNVKSGSTKFDHNPEQMSFQSHSVSPNAKDLPSTNTIPVQTFTISNPEFLMITALVVAIAAYVAGSKEKDSDVKRKSKHIDYPTEYIDYEDLRRDSE